MCSGPQLTGLTIEAILECLDSPIESIRGEVFNVGSDDQNCQIVQIGELVREVVSDLEVVCEGHDSGLANYKVSCAKIRRQLKFVPHHTVKDGIGEIKPSSSVARYPTIL